MDTSNEAKLVKVAQQIEKLEVKIDELESQIKDIEDKIETMEVLQEKPFGDWTAQEKRSRKNHDYLEIERQRWIEKEKDLRFTKNQLLTEKNQLLTEKNHLLTEKNQLMEIERLRLGASPISPNMTVPLILNEISTDSNNHLREAVIGSFTGAVQRERDMINWIAGSLDFFLKEWSKNPNRATSENPYHSCYTSIVNASMMGKSRTATILAKHGVFVFYVNVRNSTSGGYPERTNAAANFLIYMCDPGNFYPLTIYSEANACAFFLACANALLSWLQANKDKHACRVNLAEAWYDYQSQLDFWAVIIAGIPSAMSSIVEESSNLSEQDREIFRSGVIHPEKLQWHNKEDAYADFIQAYRGLMEHTASEITMIIADIDDTEKLTKHLEVLFVFDEARNLLTQKSDNNAQMSDKNFIRATSPFLVLRRALSGFPSICNSFFAVFLDTFSRISNFSPNSQFDPSNREVVSKPRRLFPPIWQLATLEVWDDCHKVGHLLGDVIRPTWYYKYGRAAFFAAIRATQPDKARRVAEALQELIKDKLTRGGYDSNTIRPTVVAALNSRITMGIAGNSRLASEIVSSCMQYCGGISDDGNMLAIRTIAEPALAVAAADIIEKIRWGPVLEELVKCSDIMDINVGVHGETAAQILRIMAHDKARKKSLGPGRDPLILYPVKMVDYLKTLLGEDIFKKIQNVNWSDPNGLGLVNSGANSRSIEELLSGAYCSVIQFSRSYAVPGARYLAQLFYRSNGMMCKQNYPGIDGLIPMLMVRPEEDLNLENISLTHDKFSHCSYQDKFYAVFPGPSAYWCCMHNMQESLTLSSNDCVSKDHIYLSILMDMGSTVKEPLAYRFPTNDPRQIAIAVRGLRPSHILSELDKAEKDYLDHQFQLLVNAHCDEGLAEKHLKVNIPITNIMPMAYDYLEKLTSTLPAPKAQAKPKSKKTKRT